MSGRQNEHRKSLVSNVVSQGPVDNFISTCFELRVKLIPGIINPSDG